jgi:hypothetical protein
MRRTPLFNPLLRSALAAILLLGLIAGAANAAKPTPTATATLSARLCELVVGYSWSKFSGKKLVATVGLYDRTVSGDVEISHMDFGGQSGRLGNVSYLASLTAGAYPDGRTLVVLGSLKDSRGNPVAGSNSESATLSSTCG